MVDLIFRLFFFSLSFFYLVVIIVVVLYCCFIMRKDDVYSKWQKWCKRKQKQTKNTQYGNSYDLFCETLSLKTNYKPKVLFTKLNIKPLDAVYLSSCSTKSHRIIIYLYIKTIRSHSNIHLRAMFYEHKFNWCISLWNSATKTVVCQ